MAALLHSESSRLYSWWWDSHISPKNSKWLQDNLTDMDAKVKAMIKLIEEDADSFARRAEMYYKKRPELMKLVEEFYRAYRALAERYDHATGELRQAHRTMALAFPDQVPFMLPDDSPSGSEQDPHTPAMPHPIRSFLEPNDSGTSASDTGARKKGLKQLQAMFGGGEAQKENSKLEKEDRGRNLDDEIFKLSNENHSLKNQVLSESEHAERAELEIQNLKKALEKMHNEKEDVLLQYKKSMEKLSKLEDELNSAQMNSRRLDEQASKAAIEIQSLKEALVRLEAERDARSLKHKEYLERISHLESVISQAQKDAQGLNERAIRAEMESCYLEKERSRLDAEKDDGLLQYKQCLEKISDLEKKLLLAQEDAKLLNERSDRAETEVRRLEKALADLNEEKNAAAHQLESCLEKIRKLESELSYAQEEIRCLNNVVELETAKLKSSQENCVLLETTNKSLQLEADNLVKKIAAKDEELSKKKEEFEKIQASLQDERLRFVQVEATLQTLQNLHFQSQEDQKALMQELNNGLQMLKELETCKHGLEEEICLIKDENRVLNELNTSSTISMEDLRNEITRLREMKQRLEEEVGLQMGQTNSLHQEIHQLKDDMSSLNKRYQEIIKEVESAGLNPECIQSSLKDLQDENLKLRQICKEDRDEKEALLKQLASVDQLLDKNSVLETSLSDLNGELKGSQEKVKSLQDSRELLLEEKSALVAEKATLLSQLQAINQNMQKLLETNAVLENSLAVANVELEGLREKSKGLEELCKVLKNDKSILLSERNSLIVQLDHVERRLQNLENRFAELETKYVSLEQEKESTLSEVKELKVSLAVEKEVRTNFALSTVAQLASLENHVQLLQEETRWKKKDFEDELDKLVNAQFEIFILQKFIQDMEQKNYSLLIECQKHVEASKLTDKLISELESENLEQQVEVELLLDEIEKLRLGIYQVFKALEIGPDKDLDDKKVNEQIFVHRIMENIDEMKCSLLSYEEDKQQLLIENSVLLSLIGQLRLEGAETQSEKKTLDQEFKIMTEQLLVVQKEKQELREMNKLLKLQLAQGDHRASALEAEMERLCAQQGDLQRSYLALQDEYSEVLEENGLLLKSCLDLKEENCRAEEENDHILLETLALQNLSVVFKDIGTQKASELKLLSQNLCNVQIVNSELEKEVGVLRKELEKKETENLLLEHSVKVLEKELGEVKDFNCQLRQEILTGKNFLCHKETELSEVKQKLKASEDLSSELGSTLEELKMRHEESTLMKENLEQHILELSEINTNQNKEIKCLNEVNRTLDSELGMLREEIEEFRIREEYLNSELQEISNEFEIWEAEATTFHFDLQTSNIREVLFENKVVELSGVCEILKHESASKTAEIEQMKERVGFMENEIGDLKAQLLAYSPIIVSLRDNVASLEHCVLSCSVLNIAENLEPEDVVLEVDLCEESGKKVTDVQKSLIPNGIPELQKLQTRIKEVEKVVREEKKRLRIHESSNTNLKTETSSKEIEELKSNYTFCLPNDKQKDETKLSDKFKLQETNPKISETRNGVIMKDIPLDHSSQGSLSGKSNRSSRGTDDQMLELWETAENNFKEPRRVYGRVCGQIGGSDQKSKTPHSELQVEKELGVDKLEVPAIVTEPNQERSNRKILERLDLDAQNLKSLRATVEELRKKLEANKRKKAKKVDLETVKEQLQEVEETILRLVEANDQLTKNIEEISPNSDGMALVGLEDVGNLPKKKVSEQAQKGSEKIGRLQLEVQKIQYVLLKLEDEKKSKGKSIVLKNFIHGGRSSPRQKRACLCGCFRPPTSPRHSNNAID